MMMLARFEKEKKLVSFPGEQKKGKGKSWNLASQMGRAHPSRRYMWDNITGPESRVSTNTIMKELIARPKGGTLKYLRYSKSIMAEMATPKASCKKYGCNPPRKKKSLN